MLHLSPVNPSELSFLLCKVGVMLFSHRVARRVKRKRDVRAPKRRLEAE